MNYPPYYAAPQNGTLGPIADPRLPNVSVQRQAPMVTDETPEPEDLNAVHKGAAWTGSIVSIIALILAIIALLLIFFMNPPSAVGRWYTVPVSTSLGTRAEGVGEVGGSFVGIKNRYIYVVNPNSNTSNALKFTGGSIGDVFGVTNTTVNTLYIYNGNTLLGALRGNSGSVLYVYRSGAIAPVRTIQDVEPGEFL